MGVVNKIFTSVSDMYNSVNPLTLSGVNDVIVIKRKDGSYKCSPFQLRFSRLQFLNSRSQIVHLFINGQITDVNMTITPQGDLYFEETVDFDVSYISKEEYDVSLINAIMENPFFNTKTMQIIKEPPKNILNNHFKHLKLANELYKSSQYSKSSVSLDLKQEKIIFSEKDAAVNNEKYKLNNYLSNEEILMWKRKRYENLNMRIYSKNLYFTNNLENYYDLSVLYDKFSFLLVSTEHFEFLMGKYTKLLEVIEDIYKDDVDAYFSLSTCMYTRIEGGKPQITFQKYLTKRIEDEDNLVVLVKNRHFQFYLTFHQFKKIFLEVKLQKNRKKHLLNILENFHNESLGWNLFGTKKPVKRDIQFSLYLNSDELKSLNLKPGKNEALFKIGGIDEQLEASIYLWEDDDKIVISDIDGTITKSDVWGLISGYIGTDWTHKGVAPLFSKIADNGYKIVYLSARSLGQSFNTKEYLEGVEQENLKLPEGPVILNPAGVMGALIQEVVIKKPDEFKIGALQTVKDLFSSFLRKNVFVAGFGNKLTDVVAYNALEIPKNRIYTINTHGQIVSEYSKSLIGTYSTINDFVDTIFPSITNKNEQSIFKFNDFNYW